MPQNKLKNAPWIIPYFTGGYPNLKKTVEYIVESEKIGVDAIEIGVPFSDPIADGPTIQFSSQSALNKDVTLTKIIQCISFARSKGVLLPIFLMSYINPLFQFGFKRFAQQAVKAGVSGIIIPDLILEESKEISKIFSSHELGLILFVTPTTPYPRAVKIARLSYPFLYVVSLTGVTGVRKRFSKFSYPQLHKLRAISKGPVCVGFGISGPQQAQRAMMAGAEGVIIGSALIEEIRNNKSPFPLLKKIIRITRKQ